VMGDATADPNGMLCFSLHSTMTRTRRIFPETSKPQPLTVSQILAWADEHHRRTGRWPNRDSGPIRGTLSERWSAIDGALTLGHRTLPKGGSLMKLLAEQRGYRHRNYLPRLKVKEILAWADAHKERTGDWPNRYSGTVSEAPGETWNAIDLALSRGARGLLRGGRTLAELLADYRGRRHHQEPPELTIDQVLAWAEAYRTLYGVWPTVTTGPVGSTGETWLSLDKALRAGARGLPGGSSLPRLLRQQENAQGNHTPFKRRRPRKHS
jgi:hypothetical protein